MKKCYVESGGFDFLVGVMGTFGCFWKSSWLERNWAFEKRMGPRRGTGKFYQILRLKRKKKKWV